MTCWSLRAHSFISFLRLILQSRTLMSLCSHRLGSNMMAFISSRATLPRRTAKARSFIRLCWFGFDRSRPTSKCEDSCWPQSDGPYGAVSGKVAPNWRPFQKFALKDSPELVVLSDTCSQTWPRIGLFVSHRTYCGTTVLFLISRGCL